jgi:hypothetical protein
VGGQPPAPSRGEGSTTRWERRRPRPARPSRQAPQDQLRGTPWGSGELSQRDGATDRVGRGRPTCPRWAGGVHGQMSHLANVTPPESPTDHLPLGGSGDSALGGSHRLGSGIVRSADPAAGKERHPPRRLVVADYLGYESLLRVESEARSAPGLPRQHDANIRATARVTSGQPGLPPTCHTRPLPWTLRAR